MSVEQDTVLGNQKEVNIFLRNMLWQTHTQKEVYNAEMKRSRFLAIVAYICLAGLSVAYGSDERAQELIGTWDYMSLTISSGARVHFKPGQWTLKLNADSTWVMQEPTNAKPVNGTYEVHGSNLKLNGGNDLEYHFKLKQDGKVLELRDKKSMISASRE